MPEFKVEVDFISGTNEVSIRVRTFDKRFGSLEEQAAFHFFKQAVEKGIVVVNIGGYLEVGNPQTSSEDFKLTLRKPQDLPELRIIDPTSDATVKKGL